MSILEVLHTAWEGFDIRDGEARLLVGVGVDLVSVFQTAELIASGGKSFLDACWTPQEQLDCNGGPEHLAARWAIKEAAMKVLGVGIGQIDPTDFRVSLTEYGEPQLDVTKWAAKHASARSVTRWLVSASHENEWAVALVAGLNDAEGS